MCGNTQVHVAASWHDAGCSIFVKVENGSAVHGGPQQVAGVCSCSSNAKLVVVAESGGCSNKVARRAVWRHLYFDILNKIKMSDLEARISDIYHVISCINHFLWIL